MKYTTLSGKLLKEMFINGAYELENNKEYVNSLNVFPVPDGDTGTNMSATIMSAAAEIQAADDSIDAVANAASMGSLMGARGNSGVILSQLLRGIAKKIKTSDEVDTEVFAEALNEGVATAYRAVMKPTEGTILTVARESAEESVMIAESTDDFIEFFTKVIEKANESLDRTPELLPALKQAGVVDAGGKGLCLIYEGMLKRLKGDIISKGDAGLKPVNAVEMAPVHTENIEFGYCTEFFIKAKNQDPDKFRDEIMKYGDSIVVVGMEDIIKVHIHTNEPGTVMNMAMNMGQLSKIKIDNMREQHEAISFDAETTASVDVQEIAEEKEFAMVAVAAGEGIVNILKDLGVDYVIEGGQTMNPSTHDILEAINTVNAKNIFVFPNNKNIIMAAEQAKDISDKNVAVIPTKSIPESITAIITFNPEDTLESNVETMTEVMQDVKTGQVTYAVRDTVFNDVEVKEGNYIGIAQGKLTNADESLEDVTKALIDSMVDEDSEIVTLFYGSDVAKEDTEVIEEYILEKCPYAEVSVNYGGQPIYYYIISVE
ncbi:MAG: DAK2 domain-containing protein [Clostridium sp.]|uniref:DAK2 domain-containing protein n=1 Tax=Clostridium sp. TaxID=1506 RepID=UPI002FC6CB58